MDYEIKNLGDITKTVETEMFADKIALDLTLGDVLVITRVPPLNGYVNDSGRVVKFKLFNGRNRQGHRLTYNLSGKYITLEVVDADGVPKILQSFTRINNAAGEFSLTVPAAFYQAAGRVKEAVINIYDGPDYLNSVGSIPINFNVIQREIDVAVGKGASHAFNGQLDEINQLVIDLRDKYDEMKKLANQINDDIKNKQLVTTDVMNVESISEMPASWKQAADDLIAKLPADKFKVLMVTDSHYGDLWSHTSPYDYKYGNDIFKHLAVVDYLSQFVDVVIAGGDDINGLDGSLDHSIADLESYATDLLDTTAKADKFMLVGNHDDNSPSLRWSPISTSDVMSDDQLKDIFRTKSSLYSEHRDGDSLYFYKDYPEQKLRLIGLDSYDVPQYNDVNGQLKYPRYLVANYRQRQLDWLVNDALMTIPDEYQVLFTSHCPLPHGFTPAAESWWYQQDLLEGIINAFASGTDFEGTSTMVYGKANQTVPDDLKATVNAQFSKIGPHPVIGLWCGHVHIEQITPLEAFKQILFLADVNVTESYVGTPNALGITVGAINPTTKHVDLYGLGRATDRSYDY